MTLNLKIYWQKNFDKRSCYGFNDPGRAEVYCRCPSWPDDKDIRACVVLTHFSGKPVTSNLIPYTIQY